MYRVKNTGPKTEPWGTPQWSFFCEETRPLTLTAWTLSDKHDENHLRAWPDIPNMSCNHARRILWSNVIKCNITHTAGTHAHHIYMFMHTHIHAHAHTHTHPWMFSSLERKEVNHWNDLCWLYLSKTVFSSFFNFYCLFLLYSVWSRVIVLNDHQMEMPTIWHFEQWKHLGSVPVPMQKSWNKIL